MGETFYGCAGCIFYYCAGVVFYDYVLFEGGVDGWGEIITYDGY